MSVRKDTAPVPGSGNNVADLVRTAAQRDPERLALIGDSGQLTWSDLDRRVDAVAGALSADGFRPGDRVALRMANTLSFPVAYFAILRAGLVVVPVNPAYTARELGHILSDSGARLMLSAAELPEPAGLENHPVDIDISYGISYDSADGDATLGTELDSIGADEDLAVLMYTSGTTGAPRGAMLPHRALLANLDQCSSLQPAPMTKDDLVLLALPLFHIYGLNAGLGMIARTGATGVLMERFDVDESLALMIDQRVTNIPGAPPMYVAWLARGDRAALCAAFSRVRLATSGAAPLPADALESMRELGVEVYEGYGLTETAPVLTSTLATGRVKAGSIGQAIPAVELRLLDEGDPLAHSADSDDPFDDPGDEGTGEISVRGRNVFLGYWPDGSGGPDDEGWFPTGDVAYRDADGDLHLVDRRRDLILVSGFNVYPQEVEAVLLGHPGVREVAVVAGPDDLTGETVRAIVVPTPGAEPTEAELRAHCRAELARFKVPTGVSFVPELPHSVTGKVSRSRLRELGLA